MPPKSSAVGPTLRYKFHATTLVLAIPGHKTFDEAKKTLVEAIKMSQSSSLEDVDRSTLSPADLALYKLENDDLEAPAWTKLDNKSNIDDARLGEGSVVGISFASNGKFSSPSLVAPREL